ncbi:MAG: YiiX family permuted papain-like enzyme [Flavobacteriales bacterium]|nr:YiiX family permuted papain-like enzyme [Flavobacteriales bacterium]
MKRIKIILFLASTAVVLTLFATNSNLSAHDFQKKKTASSIDLLEGDLIFQTNISPQCQAIQLATKSKWSHVGIILKENDEWMVLEAVQPVKMTALKDFIRRGEKGEYALKRLNSEGVLSADIINAMHEMGEQQLGKNYDGIFMWSDEEMYCSELVWKIYHTTTGLEIGALQALGDFDLSHPLVKEKLEERYGRNIPLEEKMISPGAMFDSDLLIQVH